MRIEFLPMYVWYLFQYYPVYFNFKLARQISAKKNLKQSFYAVIKFHLM